MFSNTKNTLVVISLLCVSAATAFGQGIVKQGAKNLTKQVLKNNSKAAVVQKQIGKQVQMALLKKAGAASKLDKSQLAFTPLQVNGQLYYVAENGVKLKTDYNFNNFVSLFCEGELIGIGECDGNKFLKVKTWLI